jgi:phospholipid/cholesterol/gamma-HCH transport system substrate-binding protein
MIHFTKEAKIGLVGVVTLILVFIGFHFLKGRDIFRSTNEYVVYYETINGLVENNGVYLRGFKIGQVSDINIDPTNPKGIKVVLSIEKKYQIPTGSIANQISPDVLGAKAIDIIWANSNTYYKNGDVIPGKIEIGLAEQLKPIRTKLDNLLNQADSILLGARRTFDKKTTDNFKQTMSNLNTITGSLSNQSEKIDAIFSDVQSLTHRLNESRHNLTAAINNFHAISDSLSKSRLKSAIDNADATLTETRKLLTSVNQGQGSLGKLVKNDSLYYGMQHAASNLDSLLIDLKAHPKRYVHFSIFGSKKQ